MGVSLTCGETDIHVKFLCPRSTGQPDNARNFARVPVHSCRYPQLLAGMAAFPLVAAGRQTSPIAAWGQQRKWLEADASSRER